MTDDDKKLWFWITFGLLISFFFMFGFLVGDTGWVRQIKASIAAMIHGS